MFERIADPSDWDALLEIESITNPRIRDEVGDVRLVPRERRVGGPGASWVMGTFTHIGWPSRFSDGSYGVYYAARSRDCAVAETAFHLGRFLSATGEAACDMDMRVLIAGIDSTLHNLLGAPPRYLRAYDPGDYREGQALGRYLRGVGSNGIVYRSVRYFGGECMAAFHPRVISRLPDGNTHLLYHWNAVAIDRYFDYAAGAWLAPTISRG